MASTIFKSYVILSVLCIGMILIHQSQSEGLEPSDNNKDTPDNAGTPVITGTPVIIKTPPIYFVLKTKDTINGKPVYRATGINNTVGTGEYYEPPEYVNGKPAPLINTPPVYYINGTPIYSEGDDTEEPKYNIATKRTKGGLSSYFLRWFSFFSTDSKKKRTPEHGEPEYYVIGEPLYINRVPDYIWNGIPHYSFSRIINTERTEDTEVPIFYYATERTEDDETLDNNDETLDNNDETLDNRTPEFDDETLDNRTPEFVGFAQGIPENGQELPKYIVLKTKDTINIEAIYRISENGPTNS